MATTKKAASAPAKRAKAMADEHKAAMAQGRQEAKVVRDYLTALREARPKRGRRRTAETIQARLVAIYTELRDSDALTVLRLTQERLDLMNELEARNGEASLTEYETPFVDIAASYSGRNGIGYEAWRAVGVAPQVLRRAGIKR